uniref:Neutral cholesterol ester hydrolase 1 n=1 Tax=Salarias fasciatus TaxID=181472 RepID=A0A672GCH2_SALFA
MRLRLAGVVLLAAAAYYIYLPLPSGVCEPWKLMLLDAVFRPTLLAVRLGLCHRIHLLNRLVCLVEDVDARSSATLQPKGGKKLKRAVLYYHGGGWALGSMRMTSYDYICRTLAEELDAVVMSVDYRLVPEAVFPDQYEDAMAAARAFLSEEVCQRYGIDPERTCVSGDSAGGNLAAAVSQGLALDDAQKVKFKIQALIYPVLQTLDFHTSSYQQNQAVPILHRHIMIRFWLQYLGGDSSLEPVLLANNHSALDEPAVTAAMRSRVSWTALLPPTGRGRRFEPLVQKTGTPGVVGRLPALTDVRAAPLLAESEVLSRTPKAYVMTCEFDVLRDDGLMYARRLRDAGIDVTNEHLVDGFHGCMVYSQLPMLSGVGQRSLASYARWLDQNL